MRRRFLRIVSLILVNGDDRNGPEGDCTDLLVLVSSPGVLSSNSSEISLSNRTPDIEGSPRMMSLALELSLSVRSKCSFPSTSVQSSSPTSPFLLQLALG